MSTDYDPSERTPFVIQKEQAVDAIRDAIYNGTFTPGSILDEEALEEWLVLSRVSIRAALSTLIADGLVSISSDGKTKVTNPDPEQIENSVQTLGVIMSGVLRVALGTFGPASQHRASILAYQALIYAEAKDAQKHTDTVKEIYALLIESCPNHVLRMLAQRTIGTLVFHFELAGEYREPNWKMLVATWRDMMKAIEKKDPIAAQLVFEELHRLPVPGQNWDGPVWKARDRA